MNTRVRYDAAVFGSAIAIAPVSTLIEVVRMLWTRKKYVLIPVAVALVSIGGLLVWAQASAVMPFVYALF